MKFRLPSFLRVFLTLLFTVASGSRTAWAEGAGKAPAPKLLIDFTSPDAGKQVAPSKGVPASIITVDKTGIAMSFPVQPAPHSGVHVTPATGTSWDLSAYGHIEAKVTNLGPKSLPFVMHVVSDAEGWWVEENAEFIDVKPGDTKILTVYFGYQYGYEPSAAFNPKNIKELYIFLFDTNDPHSFRIEEIKAGGVAGEKPYFDPNTLSYKPRNGVILGQGATFDLAKQVDAAGVKIAAGPEGALAVTFAGGKEEGIKIKPAVGMWDLTEANQLRVKIKNVGTTAATPTVAVGPTKVSTPAPLAPGAEAEIIVPFVRAGAVPADTFESDRAKELSILSDATPGAKSLLITSIVADAPPADLPAWLGKKPPVDGDWVQTLDETFAGPALDVKKWNFYGSERSLVNRGWNRNHNQNRPAHFSKDNALLKDGEMLLRYEKKTGTNNDAEKGEKTDYATGYLTTFGKWTQRYGYFEARMKLPKAPGLWAAFSVIPDRGKAAGDLAKRTDLGKLPTDPGAGGLEFDVMELLTRWGCYRFNAALRTAFHGGKPLAANNLYVRADKDGYVTAGLLWTPGAAVFYNNGQEILRWENARVSDVQSCLRFDLVPGGSGNTLVDDATLPDDFRIDYVRAWQRKDLATPEDGPKPNAGDPDEAKN